MQILSYAWGFLAIIGMLVGFIPCLGALNWLNIPFSMIGIFVCVNALAQPIPAEKKIGGIFGIICCSIAIFVGFIRLIIGWGVL